MKNPNEVFLEHLDEYLSSKPSQALGWALVTLLMVGSSCIGFTLGRVL